MAGRYIFAVKSFWKYVDLYYLGKAQKPKGDLTPLHIYGAEYDLDLAMAIGEAFRSDNIFAYQLAEMCDECGLPQRQVATSLKVLCSAVLKSLAALVNEAVLTAEEVSFSHKLLKMIRSNTARFLSLAEELPHVRL